jgi:small-conductance mechanosensitive channel
VIAGIPVEPIILLVFPRVRFDTAAMEPNAPAPSLEHLNRLSEIIGAWLGSDVFSLAGGLQGLVLGLSLGLAWLLAGIIHQSFERASFEQAVVRRLGQMIRPLMLPLLALLLLALGRILLAQTGFPTGLVAGASSLITAWLVIRFAVTFIRSALIARLVALFAWSLAALDIAGLLDPLTGVLDAVRFSVGSLSISVLAVIKGFLAFVLLIWLALALSRLLEGRLDSLHEINASTRELIKKLSRITLVILALLIALNATGIDLTALAVFSGALGVGLGFGLQKVVANFVSGVILLMDRSIKPGDVIETQGTYGWINHLSARYTSIITRDGTEFLIPNEDMITQPVINWSFSDSRVRRKIALGVSYDSDIRKAMRLMEEAALGVDRVLENPAPVARLMGFGESSVDLELRLWINDPQAGVVNVSSDVMLAIWDSFHREGIEFPFPQRVVHMAPHPQSQDKSQP